MTIAFFAAALVAAPAAGQDVPLPPVRFPTLPDRANNAAGFGVDGWHVEAKASGDLNGDGKSDIAFVLRGTSAANRIKTDSCENPLDTNPRILGVAFAEKKGYRLALTNTTLIPRRDNPCAVDHFDPSGLSIVRGTLGVAFERMMSMGGSDTGSTTFTLRWRDNAMRLIGWDYANASRSGGTFASISANYLTRRVKTTIGRIDSDREKVSWSKMRAAPLLTIDAVGNGLEFDPDGRVSKLP